MNIGHFSVVLALSGLVLASPVSADWKKISDSIKSELDASPSLGQHEIDINVRRDQVELTGQVESVAASQTIEEIARHTAGVKSVENNLKINGALLPTGTKEENVRLSQEVIRRIDKDPAIGYHSYAVLAKDGVVTISGNVASEADRARIEQIARYTPGVKAVELKLNTALATDDNSLVGLVRQQIERRNGVDLSGIEIAANNGIVTFSGSRSNHREIDRILSLALMVPGVKDIRSQLRVDGTVENLLENSPTHSTTGENQ